MEPAASAELANSSSMEELKEQIAELERKNGKLERINSVLIERMETGSTNRAAPYMAFENSVTLAEQVRERTEELNAALAEIQTSNQALQRANETAETAHGRLVAAIESISDAFALYDKDRRLVLFNSRFARYWKGTGIEISTGLTLKEIKQLTVQHNLIEKAFASQEDSPKNTIYHLRDGRWIQINERSTKEGGLVVLHTDITELKQIENARRERELAQKSLMFQGAMQHLSQAVALVNAEGKLEVWNQRFCELSGLSPEILKHEPDFEDILLRSEIMHLTPDSVDGNGMPQPKVEQTLIADDAVIEIRTHATSTDGYVNTYTDITERYQYAETLRESEQWIRLITDNVPALIAYVGEDLCFHFTNKVYDEWYQWPRNSMNDRHVREVHGRDQFEKLHPYAVQVLAGKSVTFEIDELNAQGQKRYLLKSYVPNKDMDGRAVGFFVLVQDVTERRETALELEASYQNMEQRVRERTHELTTLNAQMRQEIIERKAIETRLLEASNEAEQANQSKTKFLAAVSHDLLQPLNAARLFAGSLLEKNLPKECDPLTHSLSNSLDDVESLLGTLVDISKLDAGAVTPDVMDFPAHSLLDNIANEYKQVAASVDLDFRFVSSSVVVRSDSQLLARILRNFLSNSIRYTEEGRILFGCRRKSAALVFEVWDTGEGIPEEKLQDIFQEFKRLEPARSYRDKGLGLGLAIVDKISSVLGHRIGVRSILGVGSVFSVEVPFGTLDVSDTHALQVTPQFTNSLDGSSIWVIDNDPAICKGMRSLLEGWGCRIVTALSLEDLESKADINDYVPDLVIADYHLDNGVTGVEVVETLSVAFHTDVPVLMITANYDVELNQHIREQGYMLLHKPIRPLKLKMMLKHMLESSSTG